MEIAVLGTGCARCKTVYKLVKKVVDETQSTATIKKVENIYKIMDYGIMMTPAVVIDGTIVSQGIIPKESDIREWCENLK